MLVGAPLIGLNDSGGARIQEGVVSLAGYAEIFQVHSRSVSGFVSLLFIVLVPWSGAAIVQMTFLDSLQSLLSRLKLAIVGL